MCHATVPCNEKPDRKINAEIDSSIPEDETENGGWPKHKGRLKTCALEEHDGKKGR
jgi:hypothetical protein